jgi:hypothetical protein
MTSENEADKPLRSHGERLLLGQFHRALFDHDMLSFARLFGGKPILAQARGPIGPYTRF